MKTYVKKILSLMLVLFVLFNWNLIGEAASQGAFHLNKTNGPSTRGNCPNCSVLTNIYCLKNRSYSYSYPHNSTCTVKVYVSNAVQGCLMCGQWQEYYWGHECMNEHSTCSKGCDVVCSIGKWWTNN